MDPLDWDDGEGFDTHVVRGLPSKPLTSSFKTNISGATYEFVPRFKGAPNAHGVKVDVATGVVTVTEQYPAGPKTLRNFLMTIRQRDSTNTVVAETIIRIHVHRGVNKIWLTPDTLTVYSSINSTPECRFTVLAEFDDKSVGDITDWPNVITWQADPAKLQIDTAGRILGLVVGEEVPVTAKLAIAGPPGIQKSTPPKKVVTRGAGIGGVVEWVTGPLAPDATNLASVTTGRANILIVSEGFSAAQKDDFKRAVKEIVAAMQKTPPFSVLRDAVNYWQAFIPSKDDGISTLANQVLSSGGIAYDLELPTPPGSGPWSEDILMYEVGLPTPSDPRSDIDTWVNRWKGFYDTQVTKDKVPTAALNGWYAFATHTPLNERDSIFGISLGSRTRASADYSHLLAPNPRRSTQSSIDRLVGTLSFQGQSITWTAVSILCQSNSRVGEAILFGELCYASTGTKSKVRWNAPAGGDGVDLKVTPTSDSAFSSTWVASVATHELGHVLGLGDEYSMAGAISVPLFADSFLNLQTKSLLLTGTAYDPDKIKWAWPRPIRIALLTAKPTATGQNFTLKLAKIAGGPFTSGDVVQIRRAPLDKNDPFAALRFKVTAVNSTDLVVANTGAQTFNPNFYDPLLKHVVVCVATTTTTPATPERKQVADPIMKRIRTHGPLTGPNCPDLLISDQEEMSPTSLPTLQKKPASPADIIGLYEGGAQQRCEVFRPAGRCKMRSGETDTVPFCQVCRYILVDKIDPLKLVVLDKLYDPDYPQ